MREANNRRTGDHYEGTQADFEAAEDLGKLITVCTACKKASCWQAVFMCQKSQWAGIIQMKIADLRKLGLENECYWKTDEELAAR